MIYDRTSIYIYIVCFYQICLRNLREIKNEAFDLRKRTRNILWNFSANAISQWSTVPLKYEGIQFIMQL